MSDVVEGLRAYQQADEDGVMVVVSRQAVCEAALEIESLRTQLAHWKVFGEHAEGERSRLQGEVMRLSHELARLRHE